jgi:NAD(P)-dependent dehydrogenase (short-subunit alcohol dehydrogenase family)
MTDHPSHQKVALVTGASSGFGALSAAALAARGYRVFGTSRQPQVGGARGVEMLALDVQSDESVAACLDQLLGAAGRLDVLVNNAGLGQNSLVEETSLEQARHLFETNFWGVARVTTAALPVLRRQHGGRIIVVSSVAGLIGAPGVAYYSASKFALEGWCEALRYEVEPFGIQVSLIEPGYFKTNAGASLLTAAHTFSEYDDIRRNVLAATERARAGGGDARRVAETIVRVAESRSPRLRYPIGLDGVWFPRFKALLPEGAFRPFVRRIYHLP